MYTKASYSTDPSLVTRIPAEFQTPLCGERVLEALMSTGKNKVSAFPNTEIWQKEHKQQNQQMKPGSIRWNYEYVFGDETKRGKKIS